ncbi:MAG TPA: efflux RND transporter periplasmic adaptor subunit, partial [Planctomycetota bacterium]|nr:efflux RND transporter periplasmic adaptor subunit [Planctomycetota bacterium]
MLLGTLLGSAGGLAAWKRETIAVAASAAASQPPPLEAVTSALAASREYGRTTTAIGTVIALQSISLHNELPGTVHEVMLTPGSIVEAGTLLVALDVAVETAELHAQQAQLALANTLLERMQRALARSAASEVDVDRALAERDVALAQVARTEAIIERKTIRAPFRARVGMADVHPGQYLREGTRLTTLQGVDDAVHVDFTVTQVVAAGLHRGEAIEVVAGGATAPSAAAVVAVGA